MVQFTDITLKSLLISAVLASTQVIAQDLPEVSGVLEGHVKGIGGIFFKVENPQAVRQWYQDNFGIPAVEPGFGYFFWRGYLESNRTHHTEWSPFPLSDEAFGKPEQQLMIN
ncbi:MAG: hypothetical protein ACI95C_002792 [Pseudohongiellaceae bacterium]